MSSLTAEKQRHHSPSPAQLDFAERLGLEIKTGQSFSEVGRIIRREVSRRGGLVIAQLKPQIGDRFEHPRNGVCEITRVNPDTRKVTLRIVATGRKFPIDAMYLELYRRVPADLGALTDAQLAEFFSTLPSVLDWCREHDIGVTTSCKGRLNWPPDSWEKARRLAAVQLAREARG